VNETDLVTSIRGAASVCGVSPFIVRGWMNRGLLSKPPWTLQRLRQARAIAEPADQPQAAHGSRARWNAGCSCATCRGAHSEIARVRTRAKAAARLPVEIRQQLLDAICNGKPFRLALRDLALTPNQVWGLTQTDEAWSAALEAALTATRRSDLRHGTMPHMWPAVSVRSVGSTSASGWLGAPCGLDVDHRGTLRWQQTTESDNARVSPHVHADAGPLDANTLSAR
jgi:hypothetical protein